KGLGVAILLTMICNQVLMVPLLSVGKYALMLFNQEPAVLEVGYRCMWWILPWYWLFILYHMFNAYMNGAGEVRVPTISSLLMFWAVRLPAAYYFAAAFGAEYIYACYPVSWAAGALISGLYYATGRWKKRWRLCVAIRT
ncbi:MAG: MATE family efflux transporter, partial [Clostridia bacterium]|nr:MATE family efflux transporter [Clostridia bacterium]